MPDPHHVHPTPDRSRMASTLPQPHPTRHLGSSHAESIVINIYIKVDINVEMEESSFPVHSKKCHKCRLQLPKGVDRGS